MSDVIPVPVSAIDPNDRTYRIAAPDPDPSALVRSVASVGLLCPLIVLQGGEGQGYTIVSGFRRFAAVTALGIETVICNVIPRKEKDRCPALAVAANAFGKGLAPGEEVRAAVLLHQDLDSDQIADSSAAVFNRPLNRAYINALIRIRGLGDDALALMDNGGLSFKAAKVLADMDRDGSAALIGLLSQVRASSGKQADIISWAREICARERLALTALCREPSVLAAIGSDRDHQDLGASANRLRSQLFKRRFPELDEARTHASKAVRELKLPKGVRLVLPDNFESTVYTLSIDFSSSAELVDRARAALTLDGHSALERLLDR